MPSSAAEIKEYALYLGFTRVGITSADDFTDFLDELKSRGDYYDFHLASHNQPLEHSRPKTIMPTARSIIIMALDYAQVDFPVSFAGKIGRIYQARCYNPPEGSINRARQELMKAFLTRQGLNFNAAINIPYRWAAARAGVTTFGRNTFAYTARAGSFVVLSGLVVDQELKCDEPTMKCPCPADCRACIEACPTGALYEPFKLDPRKCLAFNAWKTHENTGYGVTTSIPLEIREKMGQHYHGCDICQEACPRNKKKLQAEYPKDEFLELLSRELTMQALLEMAPGFFETRVQPIMYNYLRDPCYFQRNAAVALGNTGDRAYVPVLVKALNNPSEMVRAHTAWALGQLGGSAAVRALSSARDREKSAQVKNEIESALEQAT